ncbi:MAG: hypothetical protein WD577_09890 [Bacteroidales bacterium]
MSVKRRNIRNIEIITGLFLIMSVISILVAFLLKFDYTVPNASFEEDIDFLLDNISRQRVSAISWIIAGSVNLFLLPVYLIMFHRYQKGMHLFSGFLILVMAFTFFRRGIGELQLAELTSLLLEAGTSPDDLLKTAILINLRQILLLLKIGMTAFGAFTTVFTISRFSDVKFPVFGSMIAFLAGPVIITYTWLNPEHILMTLALAAAWMGLLIVGGKFVTTGLAFKHVDP